MLDTGKNLQALTAKLASETTFLSGLANRLEERDQRSKWDWVALTVGMAIAAALAGGGAFFAAKANIIANDFSRSVALIGQDDDARWCNLANGQIVSANDGSKHCAIHMPNYVEVEEERGQ